MLETPHEESKWEFNYEILKERNQDWGDPLDTHSMIATIWTGILQQYLKPGAAIPPHLVALMMDGLKTARVAVNPLVEDSYEDKHGYTELTYLIAQRTLAQYNEENKGE